MTVVYNLCLLVFFLTIFPKLMWQALFTRRGESTVLSRLKQTNPIPPLGQCVIWLHGVSVGEVRALSTLIPHIRKTHPRAFILVSTVTKTGQDAAKQLITKADAFCYLPLDFPWIIHRFVKQLKPRLLILVEGDFWFHLLKTIKKQRGNIALVNGKMSKQSFGRYSLVKRFSRTLFRQIDLFCMQSQEQLKRFLHFGIDPDRATVIDNLKYDIQYVEKTDSEIRAWKKRFNFKTHDLILTIGSTHKGEETLLLKALKPIWDTYPNLKVFLAPRHPARCEQVKEIIRKKSIPCINYSSIRHQKGNEQVIVIDVMGLLPLCYQIAHLAIVGGSFIRGIGGHNIFEPVKLGKLVLFGYHMERQKELVQTLLQLGIARQIAVDKLSFVIGDCLSRPSLLREEGERGKRFAKQMMGSSRKTWESIRSLIDNTE